MKTQTEHPQSERLIEQNVFNSLVKLLKCDTGDDNETVGLSASFLYYTISFYGNRSDDFKLITEDFGCMHKAKWVQCVPTNEQLDIMESKLADEIKKANDRLEEKEIEELLRLQEEADEIRYGRPGALYSKWY